VNNIYSPPESEVTVRAYGNINLFKRFSAWFTIILIVVTLGLYLLYWLHTRTKTLNQIVHHQISTIFTSAAALLLVASWAILTAELFFEEFPIFPDVMQYFTYLPILDMISNILVIVWFFQIIYLQYKINQLIDRRQHNKHLQTNI